MRDGVHPLPHSAADATIQSFLPAVETDDRFRPPAPQSSGEGKGMDSLAPDRERFLADGPSDEEEEEEAEVPTKEAANGGEDRLLRPDDDLGDDAAWERTKEDFAALLPTYRPLWSSLHRQAVDRGACPTCCKGCRGPTEELFLPPVQASPAAARAPETAEGTLTHAAPVAEDLPNDDPRECQGRPPPTSLPPTAPPVAPTAAVAAPSSGDETDRRDDDSPPLRVQEPRAVLLHEDYVRALSPPPAAIQSCDGGGGSSDTSSPAPPPPPSEEPKPRRAISDAATLPEHADGDGDDEDDGEDEFGACYDDPSFAPSSSASSSSSGASTVLCFDHISFEPTPTAAPTTTATESFAFFAPPPANHEPSGHAPNDGEAVVDPDPFDDTGAIKEEENVWDRLGKALSPPEPDCPAFLSSSAGANASAAAAVTTPAAAPRRELESLVNSPFVTIRRPNYRRRRAPVNREEADGECEAVRNREADNSSSPCRYRATGGLSHGVRTSGSVPDAFESADSCDGATSPKRPATVTSNSPGPSPTAESETSVPTAASWQLVGSPEGVSESGFDGTDDSLRATQSWERPNAAASFTSRSPRGDDLTTCSSRFSGAAADKTAAFPVLDEDGDDEEDREERPHFKGAWRKTQRPRLDPWDSDASSQDVSSSSPRSSSLIHVADSAAVCAGAATSADGAKWRDLVDTSSDDEVEPRSGATNEASAIFRGRRSNRKPFSCRSPRLADPLGNSDEASVSSGDSSSDVVELIDRTQVIVLDSDSSEPDESSVESSVVEVDIVGEPTNARPPIGAKGGRMTKVPTRTTSSAPSGRAFARRRHELAQLLFEDFDRKAFDGALVGSGRCQVTWSKNLRSTAGVTRLKAAKVFGGTSGNGQANRSTHNEAVIELSLKVLDREERLRDTLVHEMCHAAAWIVDGNRQPPHGPVFHKWANRAMRLLPGVLVTTTHTYEIAFKYAWQCQNADCGALLQRHSRSIDVQRQCCGSCHGGRLELVRGGRRGTADDSGGSEAPRHRPPAESDYQRFVRENVAGVRRQLEAEGSSVSQSDVFRACASLWREHKAAAAR